MTNNKTTQSKQETITAWWDAEGKAMWDARTSVGEFLGEEVGVIRFTRHGEAYMPFVTIRREQAYNKEWITLTSGGLIGRTYQISESETGKSISTYSSSDVRGQTLEEALYQMTH